DSGGRAHDLESDEVARRIVTIRVGDASPVTDRPPHAHLAESVVAQVRMRLEGRELPDDVDHRIATAHEELPEDLRSTEPQWPARRLSSELGSDSVQSVDEGSTEFDESETAQRNDSTSVRSETADSSGLQTDDSSSQRVVGRHEMDAGHAGGPQSVHHAPATG